MGILQALRLSNAPAAVAEVQAAMAPVDPSTYPLATPWSSNDLHRVVYQDIFGTDVPPNTRAAAMSLPALARARSLLVSTICRLPLVAYRGADRLPDDAQPQWAFRTDTATPPQMRLAWTIDDLIFYGWSCWARVNLADGFPRTFTRVPMGEWTLNDDGHVTIRGQVQADDQVTLIGGLHEGILSFGRDTIADARSLYHSVRQRIQNPVPQVELHQTTGPTMPAHEIDSLIDRWAAARQGKNGGVGYTSPNIELREHGNGAEQLMIEARNAASLDLARVIGVAASRIDATAPKATLNYETTTGRNLEFVEFDLALYMTPITARLSADDVVPSGQRIAFDTAAFTDLDQPATGPTTQD